MSRRSRRRARQQQQERETAAIEAVKQTELLDVVESEPDPPANVTPDVEVDLHDDGLLWLINRAVFHPRGFALGHTPGTDYFVLLGDGSEPWRYAQSDDVEDPTKVVDEDAAFRAVEAALARARMNN